MARKAWLKNGKIVMQGGKVVMCGDCPCGEDAGCACICDHCDEGTAPAWIKLKLVKVTDGTGDAPYTDGLEVTVYADCPGMGGGCQYLGFTTDQNQLVEGYATFQNPGSGVRLTARYRLYDIGTWPVTTAGVSNHASLSDSYDCQSFLGMTLDELASDYNGWEYEIEILQLGPPTSTTCCDGCNCPALVDYVIETGQLPCGNACLTPPAVNAYGGNVTGATGGTCCDWTLSISGGGSFYDECGGVAYQMQVTFIATLLVGNHTWKSWMGAMYNSDGKGPRLDVYEATVNSQCVPEKDIEFNRIASKVYPGADDPGGCLGSFTVKYVSTRS